MFVHTIISRHDPTSCHLLRGLCQWKRPIVDHVACDAVSQNKPITIRAKKPTSFYRQNLEK